MPSLVQARHVGHVTRRVRATPSGHLRKHVPRGAKPLGMHPIVALDVAPCDRLGIAAILMSVPVAEHLPRAGGRVAPLQKLRGLRAGSHTLGVERGVVEAPGAVVGRERVLPVPRLLDCPLVLAMVLLRAAAPGGRAHVIRQAQLLP